MKALTESIEVTKEQCPASWFEEEKAEEEQNLKRQDAKRQRLTPQPPQQPPSSFLGDHRGEQRMAVFGSSAAIGASSSSSAMAAQDIAQALMPLMRAPMVDKDTVVLRKSQLKKLLDCAERCCAAAAHAVDIAKAAQDGFHTEHKHLMEATREFTKYVDDKEV